MRLEIITLVLDGMPFIDKHMKVLETLAVDWHWHIVEGQAAPTADTAWCKPMPFRLSVDGTTEYLNSLKGDSRVSVYQRPQWINKTAMVNTPLALVRGECVLMQMDCDEFWTRGQLERIVKTFDDNPAIFRMQFGCNYFFGHDIMIVKENGWVEWNRAWRFRPGMTFDKHEPPILSGNRGAVIERAQTEEMGLRFDHYAYATDRQVAYKEKFYGYKGVQANWRRLQANTKWPARLKDYFYFVDSSVIVDRVKREAPFVPPVLAGGPRPDDVAPVPAQRPGAGSVKPGGSIVVQPRGLPPPQPVRNRLPTRQVR